MALFSDQVNAGAIMKNLELRLKYSQGCIEAVKKMPDQKFNKEQCGYLVKKLEEVVQVARSFLEISRSQHGDVGSSWNVTKWVRISKLLLSLQKRIEDFVGECSKPAWMEAAMTLADVSEYVSSLAFNLELCMVLFSEGECAAGQRGLTSIGVGKLYKDEVEMVKLMASVDKEYLLKKVKSVSNPSGLAKHLLERFVSDRSNPTKLFNNWVELGTHAEQLGKGSFATVYKATLFGTSVAQKTFDGPENGFFLKEVEILSQLCHPNITSMFCSTSNKKNCSIIMELMDCDLLALIRRRCHEKGDSPPFSLSESLDLMLQIAEGVNYLHTQNVIHRDLKSSNILVKMMGFEDGYVQAKVADFGLSRTKEMSASFSNMSYNQGTPRWMAPELVKPSVAMNKAVRNHKFKCDVYSFAMVCFEILTGEFPFKGEWNPKLIKHWVVKGKRPELPNDCPAQLKELIEKCWIGNPPKRPTFGTICSRLKFLKYMSLRGDITMKGSESRLDHTLSEGSGCLAEVIDVPPPVIAPVAAPSGDITLEGSESRLDHTLSEGPGCLAEVVDVPPPVIAPLAAPSGAVGGWVNLATLCSRWLSKFGHFEA